MPGVEDGYMWAALPEKEELFTRQLSKHSTGVYMELCQGVGVSFEAIAQPRSDTEGMGKAVKVKTELLQPYAQHPY
jgi:hypothetical protein